jgi:hypothetical protein
VIAVAARSADAWNGWAMDPEGFEAAAAELRGLADGRPVMPTWGGLALVGNDPLELERLRDARRAQGRSMDVWQGDARAFRRFAERLEQAGCEWIVVLPVGGEDRIEVVARAMRA